MTTQADDIRDTFDRIDRYIGEVLAGSVQIRESLKALEAIREASPFRLQCF